MIKKMRRLLGPYPHLWFIVAVLLVTATGCAREDVTWQHIQQSGVLRIGLDPTYPPFENADGGVLEGFDVDLGRALATELGLEADFVYFGYDGLYDALGTGQVDVLLSALVIEQARTRDYAYSQPYFDAGQILVVPDSSAIAGMESLTGQKVAVELGTDGHVLALEWQGRLRGMEIVPFNTSDEALSAVGGGQAAAALVDNISGSLYVEGVSGLRVVGNPVKGEPFAAVVRIEDERLLEALNQALKQLESDGQQFEAIHRSNRARRNGRR